MSTKKSYLIDFQVNGADTAKAALSGIARSAATAAAGFVSIATASALIKHSVEQAIAAETAQKKLTTAIGRHSDALIRFASLRQQVTRFDDDGTVAAMAAIGAFTSEERTIKRLTIAAQDLAEAKGMDLVSASELVAKSVYGAVNALGRYGVQTDGAAGSSKRLEEITRGIANLWGGQATAAAETLSGKMAIAKNSFDDAAQSLGESLTPAIKWAAENIKFLSDTWGELITEFNNRGPTSIDKLKGKIRELGAGMDEISMKTSDPISFTNWVRQADLEKLTATARLFREQGMAADADKITSYVLAFKALIAEQDRLAKLKRDAGGPVAPVAAAAPDKQLAADALQFQTGIWQAMADGQAAHLVQIEADGQAEIDISNAKGETWDQEKDKFRTLKQAERDEIERTRKAQILANMQAAASTLGALSQLAGVMKNGAMASKRLAQASAIIDMYAGANKAFAQGGVFGFLTGAAIIAQGLANVAQINAQQFADGGWVRGQGGSRSDTVPARLSDGERVLSAREIALMGGRGAVDAIAAGRGGGGIVINLTGPVDRDWFRDVATPEITRTLRRALA